MSEEKCEICGEKVVMNEEGVRVHEFIYAYTPFYSQYCMGKGTATSEGDGKPRGSFAERMSK